jgi:hypothetical protein
MAPGVYKVVPGRPLELGEYCFFYAGTTVTWWGAGGGLSQFFMGLFVGLFVAVFKGVFMLAAWVIQTITFIVWKLTEANRNG